MESESCGKTTSINNGDAHKSLCENCTESERGGERIDKVKVTGGTIQILGFISIIIGVYGLMSGFSYEIVSFIANGVILIMLGATMITFGMLVPHIVSIEKSMRVLKDER